MCIELMESWYRLGTDYICDCYLMRHVYNEEGIYQGQWQVNMLEEYPGEIFLSAIILNGVPTVNGTPIPNLTQEEMNDIK